MVILPHEILHEKEKSATEIFNSLIAKKQELNYQKSYGDIVLEKFIELFDHK